MLRAAEQDPIIVIISLKRVREKDMLSVSITNSITFFARTGGDPLKCSNKMDRNMLTKV